MAVTKKGCAHSHADESMKKVKKDLQIVKLAVTKNAYVLEFADKSMPKDPEIVKMAVTQK